jgi:hypothetical protein
MTVYKASQKVNMTRTPAYKYYLLYKNDPEKKIPSQRNRCMHPDKLSVHNQIKNFIRYISTDKMTLKEASTKANMNYQSAHYYYTRYLKDPNHMIPIPQLQQTCTQDQREAFLGYIVNDKMSVKADSKKANMSLSTAKDYYRKYFKQQNPDIATPIHIATHKCYTQEQIKEAMGYIISDKMSVSAASRKANVCHTTTGIHYRQYLKDNNMKVPVAKTRKRYTQDQINELVGYIVDDNMTIAAASKKANMSNKTAQRYYRQHLKR